MKGTNSGVQSLFLTSKLKLMATFGCEFFCLVCMVAGNPSVDVLAQKVLIAGCVDAWINRHRMCQKSALQPMFFALFPYDILLVFHKESSITGEMFLFVCAVSVGL